MFGYLNKYHSLVYLNSFILLYINLTSNLLIFKISSILDHSHEPSGCLYCPVPSHFSSIFLLVSSNGRFSGNEVGWQSGYLAGLPRHLPTRKLYY